MVQETVIDLGTMQGIIVAIETMEAFLVPQVIINLRMVHLVEVLLVIFGLT